MTDKLLLTITGIINFLTLWNWFLCRGFKDMFLFSQPAFQLRLMGEIHTDQTIPVFLTRIFHNKLTQFLLDIISIYIQFWDIRFLLTFLSPIGIFGLVYGIWHFIHVKKTLLQKLALLLLLVVPFVIIFPSITLHYYNKVMLLALPYHGIAFYGVWKFLQSKKIPYRTVVIIVLLIISIWLNMIMGDALYNYCMKL
jgi:hypothetical protein